MRLSGILEIFNEDIDIREDAANFSSEEIEDQKLASFELGYRAGWDDAVEASATSDRKMYEEVGKEVSRLQKTQAAELDRIAIKILAFTETLLMNYFNSTKEAVLTQKLCKKINDEIRRHKSCEVSFVVADNGSEEFLKNLENEISQNFSIRVDSNLNQGDVMMEIGVSKWDFNIDNVINEIADVLSDLSQETHEDR